MKILAWLLLAGSVFGQHVMDCSKGVPPCPYKEDCTCKHWPAGLPPEMNDQLVPPPTVGTPVPPPSRDGWREYFGYTDCAHPKIIAWKGEPGRSAWRCELPQIMPAVRAQYNCPASKSACHPKPHWTCEYGSYVLLRTEDNHRFCMKFPEPK